jgi:hypothetical protein
MLIFLTIEPDIDLYQFLYQHRIIRKISSPCPNAIAPIFFVQYAHPVHFLEFKSYFTIPNNCDTFLNLIK